jgi:hypothetical protein
MLQQKRRRAEADGPEKEEAPQGASGASGFFGERDGDALPSR